MSQPRTIILRRTVALLLVIGIGYGTLRLLGHAFAPPAETTDVAAYGSTLKQWTASGLIGHFPAAISPQATKVHLVASPGFLQGGAYLQLRMQLPAGEVVAIEEQFKKVATNLNAGGPTVPFRTADNPEATVAFPPQYTLYVLLAKDRGLGSWNHGETRGVAVSNTLNEVVYWAEFW